MKAGSLSRHKLKMCKVITLLLIFTLTAIVAGNNLHAGTGKKSSPDQTQSLNSTREFSSSLEVESYLAGLDDQQVRTALQKRLNQEIKPVKKETNRTSSIALIVKSFRIFADKFEERLSFIASGAVLAPATLVKLYRSIKSKGETPIIDLLVDLLILFLLASACQLIVRYFTKTLRSRFKTTPFNAPAKIKAGRIIISTFLEFTGMALACVAVLFLYMALKQGDTDQWILITYLVALLVLEVARILAGFIFAPSYPALRLVNLNSDTAKYLYRWSLKIAVVIAFGMLSFGLLSIRYHNEALVLIVNSLIGLAVALMIAWIVVVNRKKVTSHILAEKKNSPLIGYLARVWHYIALTYLLIFWFFWVFSMLMLGNKAMFLGLITIMAIPIYMFGNLLAQNLISYVISETAPQKDGSNKSPGYVEKFYGHLRTGFKIVIGMVIAVWILSLWGVRIPFGIAIAKSVFYILITIILAQIVWLTINTWVEKKIMVNQDGVPTRNRFSTLLELLRKFLFGTILAIAGMIILSSLGVEIGPLLAGASVIGVAIGFGSQTLVKDIVSGIFFMLDDAFRIGDYIEAGSAMGTVERISIRSLQLRHHQGKVYTIPFGTLKQVVNLSRDWAILKIKYHVPLDTDTKVIKKIIKTINKEIRADEELGHLLLEDVKSQGVKNMDEIGILMRVKFKTKPGGQFVIRKAVLDKMRKKFAKKGIEFAHRKVTVNIPSEAFSGTSEPQLIEQAVAGAASEAVLSQMERDKKDQEEKKKK